MGRIDLFHSRRTNYFKCEFWVRDERTRTGDASKYVYENKSSGWFYARPITSKSNQVNTVNGVWFLDRDHIALETDDEIQDLKQGCIVKYDEALWLVEMVQCEIHLKESEFSKHTDYKTTISLTRG